MLSIGERMKENYEHRQRYMLVRRTPVIIRVDGRTFHSWTRGLERPFDRRFIDAMCRATAIVLREMQGFRAAYVQSDEASFLLRDDATLTTEPWFGYVKAKVESISAALMSVHFNACWQGRGAAVFDARAFNIPEAEVANYFLWRAQDWQRNSLSMYARARFSHKQLHGKNTADVHEMLHGLRKNWTTDLTSQERNGTWYGRHCLPRYDVRPDYAQIEALLAETEDQVRFETEGGTR